MVGHTIGCDSTVVSGWPDRATNENSPRTNCDGPNQHPRESVVTRVQQVDPVESRKANKDESEADSEGCGWLHSSYFVVNLSRIAVDPAVIAAVL